MRILWMRYGKEPPMTCKRFEEYGNPGGTGRFAAHLKECADCAAQVENLRLLENEVTAMAADANQNMPQWSEETRQKLMQPSTTSYGRRPMLWVPVAIAAAAVIALAVGYTIYASAPSEHIAASPQEGNVVNLDSIVATAIDNEGLRIPFRMHETASAPSDARLLFRVGSDEMGLDVAGRIQIDEASNNVMRVRLKTGTIACQVAHRGIEGQFVVLHGDFRVAVVGTRFSVRSDAEHLLLVSVIDGEVKVTGPNQLVETVRAGQTLRIVPNHQPRRESLSDEARGKINYLLSADVGDAPKHLVQHVATHVTPQQDDVMSEARLSSKHGKHASADAENLLDWQEMVIEGQYPQAEKALKKHLQRYPKDADAWWLLATCRRKAGNWQGAVNAYDAVIRTAGTSRKDKARFRVATILQEKLGNHSKALTYLEAYLHTARFSKPLRAEALTRQAVSYLSVGQKTRAIRVLETVVADYGDSPVASKAKRLLQQNK